MIPESDVFIALALRYLNQRENIVAGLQIAQENPSIVAESVGALNQAITSLNKFVTNSAGIVDSQRDFLPNSTEVRNFLVGQTLPTITELAYDSSTDTRRLARQAFQEANASMKKGERASSDSEAWFFHIDEQNYGTLADGLGLEIYRKFASFKYGESKTSGYNFMLALEEMLAVHHQDTRMFSSIEKWYTPEDGFSKDLVDMVKGEVNIEPKNRSGVPVVRKTPNFQLRDGYNFIVEPITVVGRHMLWRASYTHNSSDHLSGSRFIADRTALNMRVLMGGYIDIPKEKDVPTTPSIDRMEECLLTHPEVYTFND